MAGFVLRIVRWVTVAFVVLAATFVGLDHWYGEQMQEFRMDRIPPEFGATEMAYRNEQAFGAGGYLPGDHETGVVAYPLPDYVVARIEREGMAFFEGLEPEWGGWQATPVVMDRAHWPRPEEMRHDPAESPLDVYLARYHWIEIDAAVKGEINAAMLQPGSYYRYGHGRRLVLVAPAARRAYLIYAG